MSQRFLVVDNDELTRTNIQQYFAVHGHQVDCAQGKNEAKALLARSQYSVVITDLRLNGTNTSGGLELCRYVSERYPETKSMVLHTPMPLAELRQIALQLLGSES